MRGHISAVILTLFQSGPPSTHSCQKKPLLPKGVLNKMIRPLETAIIGLIDIYNESSTLAASSTINSDTPENPLTVLSLPGKTCTRLPLASSSLTPDSSVRSGTPASKL